MPGGELNKLITIVSRLPGMGDKSATRIVVHLLEQRDFVLDSLIQSLLEVREKVKLCERCNNIDIFSPCSICSDQKREQKLVCVVADIADLWAVERAGFFSGVYHVLGGKLSAMDGILPSDLETDKLRRRIVSGAVEEIVIAIGADLDGQTTLFFVHDLLKDFGVKITTLSHGVPVGWDLESLDNGTIMTAFNRRQDVS